MRRVDAETIRRQHADVTRIGKIDRHDSLGIPGRADSTSTLVPRNTASGMLWVMKMMVLRLSCHNLSSSILRFSRVIASRAPKGSSISRLLGSWMSERAIATRCCMPPESS